MLWLVAWSFFALAPAGDAFGKAQQAYDNYDFAPAAQLYRKALATGQLDPLRAAQARLRLGFSLFISQDRAGAEAALADLFDKAPGYVLERRGVHPDLLKFYDDQHDKWQSARTVAAPVAAAPAAEAKVTTPGYRPAPWPLRLLPLGIGQFANGDPVGGGIWLSVELLMVGLNVVSSLEHFSLCDANQANCRDLPTARAWFYMQDVSAGLIIATAVAGVIDALVWSPGRGEARYKARLTLAPIAHGGAAGLALSF